MKCWCDSRLIERKSRAAGDTDGIECGVDGFGVEAAVVDGGCEGFVAGGTRGRCGDGW